MTGTLSESVVSTIVAADAETKVRPAGVAGSFYPAPPAVLTRMMDQMLGAAHPSVLDGPIVAVVAPHAGYPYSGPVAAWAYAALKGHPYARVVVIAPSHVEGFDFSSVYDGDAYETPLGRVPVDKEFARRLAGAGAGICFSSRGHAPGNAGGAQNPEHALEVQLPWLQRVLGNFELVPVIMGDQSYQASRALGFALSELIASDTGKSTLIVASSDLSHFHTCDEAEQMDRKTLSAIERWDTLNLSRNFGQRVWEACGGAPIVAAMIASEHTGANRAVLLNYANSGDVTHDKTRVVGYGAVAFIKSSAPHAELPPFTLSIREQEQLLSIARKSVEHAVREHRAYDPGDAPDVALSEECGAFVTLTIGGQLRGCIGYTDPILPLYKAVRDAAILAASRDPRFPPVAVSELPDLEYEISVLSPLRRVRDIHEIRIGEHGLMIKNGDKEGLLLPQVATDRHWDRTTFLGQTCVKAGLPQDSWRDKSCDVFLFTAAVFS